MKHATPNWLAPIAAILILQTTSSFLSRLIPIITPAVSEEFGWSGSAIGYFTASNSFGSLAILIAGSAVLKAIGGMRTLQLTLVLGTMCLGLFLSPSISVVLAACFLMGISNGVASPAGSEILLRFSPPGKRNLMFSIKQAGVPLGGIIAGLCIPGIVVLWGWRAALLVCGLIVLIPTAITWALSSTLDGINKKISQSLLHLPTLRSFRSLAVPLASLARGPGLFKMSIVGSLFAVAQSCWFTFTVIYLVDAMGYSLALAGAVFAVMQTGGVLGRVMLGWLSDYFDSSVATLSMTAVLSATTTALMGLTNPDWPVWTVMLLAFVAGSTAASWNGVQIAEIARRSPPEWVSETAAGASVLVNLVNMIAPACFASYVVFSGGRYDYAFISAGVCTLLVLVFMPWERKRGSRTPV